MLYMKYIIIGLIALGAIGIGYVSFFGDKSTLPASSSKEVSTEKSKDGKNTNTVLSFDASKCTSAGNGAYICTPESLGNFDPQTIIDTATGNTCVISYDRTKGFSFRGPTQNAEIPAGSMAASINPDGSLVSLAIQGRQTLTFFTGGGPISSAMLVGQGIDRCTATESWN